MNIDALYKELSYIIPDYELKLSNITSMNNYCITVYKLSLINDYRLEEVIINLNNHDKLTILNMAINYNIKSLEQLILLHMNNIDNIIEDNGHILNCKSYAYLFENNIIGKYFDENKLSEFLEWYVMNDNNNENLQCFKLFCQHTKFNIDLMVSYWNISYVHYFVDVGLANLRKYKSITRSIYRYIEVFEYFSPSKDEIVNDLNNDIIEYISSEILPHISKYITDELLYKKHYRHYFDDIKLYNDAIIPDNMYNYIDYKTIDENILIKMYHLQKININDLISKYLDTHDVISDKLHKELNLNNVDISMFWNKLINNINLIDSPQQLKYLHKYIKHHNLDIVSKLTINTFKDYLKMFEVNINDIISNNYEFILKLQNFGAMHINIITDIFYDMNVNDMINITTFYSKKFKFTSHALDHITLRSTYNDIVRLIDIGTNRVIAAINDDDEFNYIMTSISEPVVQLLNICIVYGNQEKLNKFAQTVNINLLTKNLITGMFYNITIKCLDYLNNNSLLDYKLIKCYEEMLINNFINNFISNNDFELINNFISNNDFELFKYFMIHFNVDIMLINWCEYKHIVFLCENLNYNLTSLKSNVNILECIYNDIELLKYFNINYFDDNIGDVCMVPVYCLELITENRNVEIFLCSQLLNYNHVDIIEYIIKNYKLNIDVIEHILIKKRTTHKLLYSHKYLLLLHSIGINTKTILLYDNYIEIIEKIQHCQQLFDNINNTLNIDSDYIFNIIPEISIHHMSVSSFDIIADKLEVRNDVCRFFDRITSSVPLKIIHKYLTKEQSYKYFTKITNYKINTIQYIELFNITKDDIRNNNYELLKKFWINDTLIMKLHKDLGLNKYDFIYSLSEIDCSNCAIKYLHTEIGLTYNDFRIDNNKFLIKLVEDNKVLSVKYLYNSVGFTLDDFKVNNSYLLGVSLGFTTDTMSNFLINVVGMSLDDLDNGYVYTNINGENFYKPAITINKSMLNDIKVINNDKYICDICSYEVNDEYKYIMNCCKKNICIDCGERSIGKQAAICAFCRKKID